MSLEAFISGKSSLSSTGALVPNQNQHADEHRLAELAATSPSSKSSDSLDDSITLANRTSNLISSYRDYISNQDDIENNVRDRIIINSSAPDRSSSSPSSPNHRPPHVSFTNSNHGIAFSNGDPLLLRDWNHNHNNKFGRANNRERSADQKLLDISDISHTFDNSSWDNNNNDDDGTLRPSSVRYAHPIYHSKKFKRVILGVVCVTAIIGTFGIVKHTKRESSLPNWNEELKKVAVQDEEDTADGETKAASSIDNIEKVTVMNNVNVADKEKEKVVKVPAVQIVHEKQSTSSTSSHYVTNANEKAAELVAKMEEEESAEATKPKLDLQPAQVAAAGVQQSKPKEDDIEATTRHILCCSSPITAGSSLEHNKRLLEGAKDASSSTTIADKYAHAESYHPKWYHRSDGWSGTTYTEAVDFCASRQDDDLLHTQLCPYEVYCPTGSNSHVPLVMWSLSLSSVETSSRAPVSNEVNGWVQIDGGKRTCVQYTMSELNDTEEKDDMVGEEDSSFVDDEKTDADKEQEAGDDQDNAAAAVSFANPNDEAEPESDVPPEAEDQPIASSSVTSPPQTAIIPTDNFDVATIFHEQFKPLWLGSSEGWHGGSHDDAVTFCNSVRGKTLCPYTAMCPNGVGRAAMGGRHQLTFHTNGEQYAPVMGGNNQWVMIGTKDGKEETTCMTHRQLEGKAPTWGLNTDRSEMKQHIMCCTDPNNTTPVTYTMHKGHHRRL